MESGQKKYETYTQGKVYVNITQHYGSETWAQSVGGQGRRRRGRAGRYDDEACERHGWAEDIGRPKGTSRALEPQGGSMPALWAASGRFKRASRSANDQTLGRGEEEGCAQVDNTHSQRDAPQSTTHTHTHTLAKKKSMSRPHARSFHHPPIMQICLVCLSVCLFVFLDLFFSGLLPRVKEASREGVSHHTFTMRSGNFSQEHLPSLTPPIPE